jgi:hypothetical protein
MLEIQASEDGWTLDGPGIQKLVARVKQSNDTLASFNPPVVDSNNTSVTFVPLSEVPLSEQAVGDYQTTGRVTSVATLIPRGRSLRVDGVFPTA